MMSKLISRLPGLETVQLLTTTLMKFLPMLPRWSLNRSDKSKILFPRYCFQLLLLCPIDIVIVNVAKMVIEQVWHFQDIVSKYCLFVQLILLLPILPRWSLNRSDVPKTLPRYCLLSRTMDIMFMPYWLSGEIHWTNSKVFDDVLTHLFRATILRNFQETRSISPRWGNTCYIFVDSYF